MEKTVAKLNIEHYRNLLFKESDESRRQTLIRLLADEEAKLALLMNPQKESKRRH
jgi:hypothetical protein